MSAIVPVAVRPFEFESPKTAPTPVSSAFSDFCLTTTILLKPQTAGFSTSSIERQRAFA